MDSVNVLEAVAVESLLSKLLGTIVKTNSNGKYKLVGCEGFWYDFIFAT